MQIAIAMSSYFVINSPRKRKAMRVAKIGEVFWRKASLESEISLTAELNTKKVTVPEIALIITSSH